MRLRANAPREGGRLTAYVMLRDVRLGPREFTSRQTRVAAIGLRCSFGKFRNDSSQLFQRPFQIGQIALEGKGQI